MFHTFLRTSLPIKIRTVDLPDFVRRIFVVLKILCEGWNGGSVPVVERYIEQCERVDMPRSKNAFELGFGVWLTALATLELHTFSCEGPFILCEIEGSRVFRHVRQNLLKR